MRIALVRVSLNAASIVQLCTTAKKKGKGVPVPHCGRHYHIVIGTKALSLRELIRVGISQIVIPAKAGIRGWGGGRRVHRLNLPTPISPQGEGWGEGDYLHLSAGIGSITHSANAQSGQGRAFKCNGTKYSKYWPSRSRRFRRGSE